MSPPFVTDADLPAWHPARGCRCPLHGRRRLSFGLLGLGALGAAAAAAAQQAEGVGADVGKRSSFAKLVPAEKLEQAAAQQFVQMQRQAAAKQALAPDSHPQLQRLRYIARRLIPFTPPWNPRAAQWKWEVALIGSPQINAFCLPGGRIAFFWGILQRLQLGDDEVAMIMGHEMAHALREHARERIGKGVATRGAVEIGSALLGLGDLGRLAAGMGEQLLTLVFSRDDESEADLVGMELAARAGYDPAAGITLWQKMDSFNKGGPPEFLSTHPSGPTRIKDIEAALPKVEPLYARAPRPERRFGPPPVGNDAKR
ncbi:MAG: M48 family metallopeptidase [Burkholderiales bacterium]|nr:M48 family metallopeptidase [Burkholderiales bacterium]